MSDYAHQIGSVSCVVAADDEIGSVCRIIEQTNDTLHSCIADISAHLYEMSRGDFTNSVTLEYAGYLAPIKTSLNRIISELGNVFSAPERCSPVRRTFQTARRILRKPPQSRPRWSMRYPST